MERWGREFLKLLETIANSGYRDLELLDLLSVLLNNLLYVMTLPPNFPLQNPWALCLGGQEMQEGPVHTPIQLASWPYKFFL